MKKIINTIIISILLITSCTKSNEEFSDTNPINKPPVVVISPPVENKNLPQIASFVPEIGAEGTEVMIYGDMFTQDCKISINNVVITPQSIGKNSIRIIIPQEFQSSGPITISNVEGKVSTKRNFIYDTEPTIASFSPSGGSVDDVITITGTKFTTDSPNILTINGFNLTPENVTTKTMTFVVPEGITSGKLIITNKNGSGESSGNFFFDDNVNIISFSPLSAKAGETVTIEGNAFTPNSPNTVTINGISIEAKFISRKTLTFLVPVNVGSGKINVSNSKGSKNSIWDFTFIYPPKITEMSPTNAFANELITLRGTNFTSNNLVYVGGVKANTAQEGNSNMLQFNAPATGGSIYVINENGSSEEFGYLYINIEVEPIEPIILPDPIPSENQSYKRKSRY
jgi:hypothetical protein